MERLDTETASNKQGKANSKRLKTNGRARLITYKPQRGGMEYRRYRYVSLPGVTSFFRAVPGERAIYVDVKLSPGLPNG